MLRPVVCLGLGALLAGCGGAGDRVTLEFASQAALEHTNVLSVTAFEPFVRSTETEAFELVRCEDVSTFSPMQRVSPDTIAVSNLVGRVLLDRESDTYPLDGDWSVSFDRPDPESENNPWGAMMVYIEARGDARASERGSGQVAATLLSGCYCVRTREGGVADPALSDLDDDVREECPLLTELEAEGNERVVQMSPLPPPEFHLRVAGGSGTLSTPRDSMITPGPQVELRADRCDNVVSQQDCFRCEQPCDELDDRSSAPVLFTVRQSGGGTRPTSQVVLTNEEGLATASIEVDDCSAPITIEANVVGRPEESITFEVDCVEPVPGFECLAENELERGYEAVSVSTVPGDPRACSPSTPDGCDHVAVMYETGTDALLEIRSPLTGVRDQILYPDMRAHAVHGFEYAPGISAVIVVLTAGNTSTPRIFVYEWREGRLVRDDDTDGELTGPCPWLDSCHSQLTCGEQMPCSSPFETCREGACRLRDPCWPDIQLQSQVTVDSRDVDGDGRLDVAIGNSNARAVMFFRSSEAGDGELYAGQGCSCARFGQAPNGFALVNIGGGAPNPAVADIVLGAAGGTFLRYAESTLEGPTLSCGSSTSLRDSMSVRDVKGASLSCPPDDASCVAYDDAIIVSARGISGGSLDEPGFIRVFFGSGNDLSRGTDPLLEFPEISVGLVPRSFAGRGEPRDPRTAQLTDFNADGHEDLSVLYKASEEVHIWLGASNRALGEIENGVVLEDCPVSIDPGTRCAPLLRFATPDLDGDGRAEVAVVCDPMGARPRIRYFKATD